MKEFPGSDSVIDEVSEAEALRRSASRLVLQPVRPVIRR